MDACTAWAIVSAPVNKMRSRWQPASASYLSQRLELDSDKRFVYVIGRQPAYKVKVPLPGTSISVTEPSAAYSDPEPGFSHDGSS